MIVETSALRDGVCPASASPMPLPAIPSIEQVGESIIAEARNLMDHREAKHPSKPDVAWGGKPNGDRTIRTDCVLNFRNQTSRNVHMAKGRQNRSLRAVLARRRVAIARQICSNDTASAATAASYRYESRVRELQQRFEIELQGVRDAYLQQLAGLDLEGQ